MDWSVIRTSADGNCMYMTLALAEHARRALQIAQTAPSPAAARDTLRAEYPPLKEGGEPFKLITSNDRVVARARAIRAEVAAFFSMDRLATPLAFDINAWIPAHNEATGEPTTLATFITQTVVDEDPDCAADPVGCMLAYAQAIGKNKTWAGTPEMYAYAVLHNAKVLAFSANGQGDVSNLEDGVVPPAYGHTVRMLYQVWDLAGGGSPKSASASTSSNTSTGIDVIDIDALYDDAMDKSWPASSAKSRTQPVRTRMRMPRARARGPVLDVPALSGAALNAARAKHFSLLLEEGEVELLRAVYGPAFIPTVKPVAEYSAAVGLVKEGEPSSKKRRR